MTRETRRADANTEETGCGPLVGEKGPAGEKFPAAEKLPVVDKVPAAD